MQSQAGYIQIIKPKSDATESQLNVMWWPPLHVSIDVKSLKKFQEFNANIHYVMRIESPDTKSWFRLDPRCDKIQVQFNISPIHPNILDFSVLHQPPRRGVHWLISRVALFCMVYLSEIDRFENVGKLSVFWWVYFGSFRRCISNQIGMSSAE